MFEVLKTKTGLFYFQYVEKNGKPIMKSKTYTRKLTCIKRVEATIQNIKSGDGNIIVKIK